MAETLTRYDIDKTPLAFADKAMFIHHLNEEHQDELAMFINAFTLALPGYSSLLDAEANHSSKLQAQRPSNVGIASHGGAQ